MSKRDDKNQLDKLKEQFSRNAAKEGGEGGGDPKRKFNFYWIYGALVLLILGTQIFGSFSTKTKSSNFR